MDRKPIEVTRTDKIYCLKVNSDYHSEVCEECKFYPNCDHMTQDYMTEVTIRDLEKLDKIEEIVNAWNNNASHTFRDMCNINEILKG